MTISGARVGIFPPVHQPDATLSQNNPVSATLYTVLDTTKSVRLIRVAGWVTWTSQPTMDFVITIDGQTLTFSRSLPVSGSKYVCILTGTAASSAQQLGTEIGVDAGNYLASFLMEGRSIKVEIRCTGGTVSNLSARIIYAKW